MRGVESIFNFSASRGHLRILRLPVFMGRLVLLVSQFCPLPMTLTWPANLLRQTIAPVTHMRAFRTSGGYGPLVS
jgi:hypothetical protein